MIEEEDRGRRLGLVHCGSRGRSPTTDDSDEGDDDADDDAVDDDDTAADDETRPEDQGH
jgi:hypothetical protein